jgi:hypothetical protein
MTQRREIRVMLDLSPDLRAVLFALIGKPLPQTTAAPDAPPPSNTRKAYRTDERVALVVREWPGNMPTDQIRAAVDALPGAPVPRHAVAIWANGYGLHRPKDLLAQEQRRRRLLAENDWRTPERATVLAARWLGPWSELVRAVRAVPGPEMPQNVAAGLMKWARDMQLGPRPQRQAPAPVAPPPPPPPRPLVPFTLADGATSHPQWASPRAQAAHEAAVKRTGR